MIETKETFIAYFIILHLFQRALPFLSLIHKVRACFRERKKVRACCRERKKVRACCRERKNCTLVIMINYGHMPFTTTLWRLPTNIKLTAKSQRVKRKTCKWATPKYSSIRIKDRPIIVDPDKWGRGLDLLENFPPFRSTTWKGARTEPLRWAVVMPVQRAHRHFCGEEIKMH